MSRVDDGDKLKLYLFEKALQVFGEGSVGSFVSHGDELQLYLYPGKARDAALALMEQSFPAGHFDDASVLSQVSVGYDRIKNYGLADEQMYRLTLEGPLTEMVKNVEKNDKDVFDAAQASHRAQALLRQEKQREAQRIPGGL